MANWAPVDADASDWVVGIDFGTAFSKVAATRLGSGAGAREIMPFHIGAAAQGRRSLVVPSALFLNQDVLHFGPRAVEALVGSGDEKRQALQSFKTILGAEDFERAIELLPVRSLSEVVDLLVLGDLDHQPAAVLPVSPTPQRPPLTRLG